jgi:hypothetical protein
MKSLCDRGQPLAGAYLAVLVSQTLAQNEALLRGDEGQGLRRLAVEVGPAVFRSCAGGVCGKVRPPPAPPLPGGVLRSLPLPHSGPFPLARGRLGRGLSGSRPDRAQDHLQDAFRILENLRIPEAEHAISLRLQPSWSDAGSRSAVAHGVHHPAQ